jgi:phosphoadenosine phosphosulfate reductase
MRRHDAPPAAATRLALLTLFARLPRPYSRARCLCRNAACDARRLDALEAALAADLATAAGAFASPVLTWAGLAGDCALLDAAARAGLLGRVAVVFIDTLHLFPETLALLADSEKRYGFAAKRYSAVGCATKAEWNKRHASDLYMTDPEQYDQARRVMGA